MFKLISPLVYLHYRDSFIHILEFVYLTVQGEYIKYWILIEYAHIYNREDRNYTHNYRCAELTFDDEQAYHTNVKKEDRYIRVFQNCINLYYVYVTCSPLESISNL